MSKSCATTTISRQYLRTAVNDDVAGQSKSRSRSRDATTCFTVPITSIHNTTERQLPRPDSSESSYRDGTEAGSSITQSLDDTWINQLPRSNADNTTWIVQDKKVQALITQMTRNSLHYPIDIGPNSELIERPNTQLLSCAQDIAVRHFKPNTLPPPKVYL
jgi:hypothetical protein